VAKGPGIKAPYWPTAKPYQPDSPEFMPYVFSSTGPVWIDVDGDSQFSSPRDIATRIVRQCGGDLGQLVGRLSDCDASVIHQAASLLRAESVDLGEIQEVAPSDLRKAIAEYRQAWRGSIRARLEQIE
jgi:hypothetical protein